MHGILLYLSSLLLSSYLLAHRVERLLLQVLLLLRLLVGVDLRLLLSLDLFEVRDLFVCERLAVVHTAVLCCV